MKSKEKLKNDKYKSKRSGKSKLFNIHCRKCMELVAIYQKDGRGNLRRMYMDRITWPKYLTNLQQQDLSKLETLKCPKCHKLLATPYLYQKEQRPAFRIIQEAAIKRLKK